MARITTILIIFFVAMNLFAGIFLTTGTAAMLGVDDRVTQDQDVDKTVDDRAKDGSIDTGAGTGSTLFGLYNSVLSGFIGLFEAVAPALKLLTYAGVPRWVTGTFFASLFGIAATIDGMSFVRGYDL